MEGTALRPIAGAHPHLSRAAWLAWASVALFAVLATVSLFLEVRFVGRATLLDIWAVIALAASGVVGALIVSAHPRHPIGWMFCAAAVSFGVSFFSMQYAILALVVQPGTLPFGQAMAWFGFWAEMPGIAVVALTMVAPDTYANAGYASIRNPIGLDQYKPFFDAVGNAMQPLLFGLVVVSAVALFDRVRRADTNERQQLKWFAYAGGLILLSFVLEAVATFIPSLMVITDLVNVLAITALPAAVGIAILRNGLYDIDLIINRTVVYVLLTAALAGVYTASVALFQRMFVAMTGQGSDIAIVMTLFVLATVFTPVKNTLQETVDRRIKPTQSHVAHAAARVSGIDDLLMLAELHDRGVLTDEEFSAKKKQLLLL